MPKGDGNRGKGKGIAWIKANVNYAGDDCLIWPFARNNYGYGLVGINNKVEKASRIMCEFVHGPAPADKPQAAHNCGNGHGGCCNPRHLEWKDNSENQIDRRLHGAPEGAKGTRTNLTPDQIAEIRASRGLVPQMALAKLFNVKRGTIEYWQRHSRMPRPQSTSAYNIARRERRTQQGKDT